MRVGDLVNYTSVPFDGPTVNGLVLDSRVALKASRAQKKNVNSHQVYWATHGITNWVMEKDLETADAGR